MMGEKRKSKDILWKIFLILLVISILFYAGYYLYLNLAEYSLVMDSDIAAEALLARTMWESKSLIPTSWIGSSETRILSVSALGSLFYGLCGSMTLSAGLSCSVFIILILVLYAILGRKSHLSRISILVSLLLILSLPGSIRHAEILYLYAGYYAPHVAVMLFTLSFYLDESLPKNTSAIISGKKGQDKTKRCAISSYIIVFFLAFAMSLSGMRIMLILYAPLFVVEFLRWVMSLLCRRFPWRSLARRKGAGIALGCIAFSILGTLAPTSVSLPVSSNFRNGFSKMKEEVLEDCIDCLGWNDSGRGVRFILLVFLGMSIVMLIYSLILPGFRKIHRSLGCSQSEVPKKEEQDIARKAICLLFFWISLIVTVFAVSFLTIESVWRYYFMLYFILSYSVALLVDRIGEMNGKKTIKALLGSVVCLFCFVFSFLQWDEQLDQTVSSKETKEDTTQIVSWMLENGIEYGYSTFETANRMTIEADGAVQISAVDGMDTLGICRWLTDTRWYVPSLSYDMDTAYIVPKSEEDLFAIQLSLHDDYEEVLETEEYIVYLAPHNYTDS